MVVMETGNERIFLRGGRPTRHVATYTYHTSRDIIEFNGVEIGLMDFIRELHLLANRYEESYDTIVVRSI